VRWPFCFIKIGGEGGIECKNLLLLNYERTLWPLLFPFLDHLLPIYQPPSRFLLCELAEGRSADRTIKKKGLARELIYRNVTFT
jgi:hypothetical protein